MQFQIEAFKWLQTLRSLDIFGVSNHTNVHGDLEVVLFLAHESIVSHREIEAFICIHSVCGHRSVSKGKVDKRTHVGQKNKWEHQ